MSELLVPIAISSQLDSTGEERIHAAKYTPTRIVSYTRGMAISGDLPDMAVGDTINFQYTFVPSVPAVDVTFSISAGALPDGLSLDPDTGAVTGTATTSSFDNSWTVLVTPESGDPVSVDDTAYVMDMIGTPPNASVGDDYNYLLTGSNGTPEYVFTLASGDLPTGTTLNADGTISGHITESGTFIFSVTMVDDNGVDQTKMYDINVDVSFGTIYVGSSSLLGVDVPLTVVDGDTNTVSDTALGSTQLLFPSLSTDKTRVYVYENLSLSYLQVSDNTLHVLVPAGGSFYLNAGPVVCDATDTYLYAGDFDHGVFRKIRIADGVEVATITAGGDITCLAWIDEDKTILGMGTYTDQHMRRYDTVGETFLSNVDNTGTKYQKSLSWCPTTGYVYSCGSIDEGMSYLLEYHPDGLATSQILLPFFDQCRAAITPDGTKAYVVNITNTSGPTAKLVVIDTVEQEVITTLTLATATPNFVAINSTGTRAYVACDNSTLYVIDTVSDIVLDAVPVGTNAHGVAILESS